MLMVALQAFCLVSMSRLAPNAAHQKPLSESEAQFDDETQKVPSETYPFMSPFGGCTQAPILIPKERQLAAHANMF
jgi:hypothetical protein